MQIYFLIGLIYPLVVYGAEILKEWEKVDANMDGDYITYSLWRLTGKSLSVCGTMCSQESNCMSFTWNSYHLTCNGFSKIFYSPPVISAISNRYYRRKDLVIPKGYITTPPLENVPVVFKFIPVPTQVAYEALEACQQTLGTTYGTLLRIRNIATINYIGDYLISVSAPNDVFIDGNVTEGEDSNLPGTQWKYSDQSDVTYKKWAPTEPISYFGSVENCLTLQNDYFGPYFKGMNNKICNEALPYLCQYDIYA